jgi:hypothetical protein
MDTLEREIKRTVKDGKITCKEALELAERLGINPAIVGNVLNKMKIKIKGCQLGCFQ